MKFIKKVLGLILCSVPFLVLQVPSYADNDNLIKFEIEVKPNQQQVKAHIDGDEHKQIQIKGEFVKLNTITNNYHIKITLSNNSGQPLRHQLAVIEKVEHSEIKFPDGSTSFNKPDDNKQKTVTGPYYNYGHIKPSQATPREWYLANAGKDEIEIKGCLIEKEIPVVLDPKIVAQVDAVAVATLTKFLTGLRDNDLDIVIATIAGPDVYLPKDLHKNFKNKNYDKALPYLAKKYSNITSATQVRPDVWMFGYRWNLTLTDENVGGYLELKNFGGQVGWLIYQY